MRAVPLNRYLTFFLIAGGGVAADLATKRFMFDWLKMPGVRREPYWIIDKFFGFESSLNEGALFGVGQGMVWFFSLLSIAAAVAIIWYLFAAGGAKQWILTIALSGIMAGILGNLFDRTGIPGLIWNYTNDHHKQGDPVFAVRDWILVKFGAWPWPNFNIADSLLVCGAMLLVCHALFAKNKEHCASSGER
jgi:signal peptidase II